MLKKIETIFSSNAVRFLLYVLFGVFATAASLLLFAVVITTFDLPEYYNGIFATFSLIIGAFISAYFYVKKINQKGFLNGALIGFSIYIIIFIVSLVVSDNGFTLTSIFHLLATVFSGSIAGILQVNKKQNLKYLK